MSVGWNGGTPASFTDASDYNIGTKYHVNADITITDIRIFGGDIGTMGNRKAYLWSGAGGLLATVNLPNSLIAGWALYALTAPVDINTGSDFWVTYDVVGSYGLVNPGGYPVVSADGLVTATGGGFNNTIDLFPDTSSGAFFGVDIQYNARAGNQRPVAGLAVSATGPLQAQAVVTITDETPATCSAVVEWGDGQSSSGTGPQTFTHTYAVAGTYAVMVTVTDSGGLTDSAAVPVLISPSPSAMTPNDELVACRWLATIPGITSAMVGTTLPRDNSTWAASGFVQVPMVAGGNPDLDVPMRNPVVQVELWAANPNSQRPPWWKASHLGELIIAACQTPALSHQLLSIGGNYRNARVTGAAVRSGPRRLPRDVGAYAHYVMDLALDWAAV